NAEGEKSHGYREDGYFPDAFVNMLAMLGWNPGDDREIFSMKELVEFFDGGNLNSSPAAFDPEKLKWLNAQYLRSTPLPELAAMVRPFLSGLGYELPVEKIESMLPMYVERTTDLAGLAAALTIYCRPAEEIEIEEKAMKALNEDGRNQLTVLHGMLAELPDFTAEAIDVLLHRYVEEGGLKFKQVGPPLRSALTGLAGGPSVHDVMFALGREESLRRSARAAAS
ncbi:MAG: glutamate--tRNA ligase family protein, partial [Mailhella sp.]|nr:glutamate--tRNA ligase family protein [Mailhella sp.]